jgi:hypothetical protein
MAALFVMAAGCSTASDHPVRRTEADPVSRLVSAAWVSDGTNGFFVDQPWSPTSAPWSLDLTYWNVSLAHREHVDTGVSPDDVRRWARAAFRGRLDSSGLPTVFQVAYAVELYHDLGLTPDEGAAVRTIEGLRAGARYRPDRKTKRPNWGATALAVKTLRSLHRALPREVTTGARGELSRIASQPVTAARAVETVVPVIETYLALAHRHPRIDVEPVALRAWSSLDGAPQDIVTLSSIAELHRALRDSGLRAGRATPENCAPASDDTTGQPAAQLVSYGAELGCQDVRPAPTTAPSPSGWVDPSYVQGNVSLLASTRAGLSLVRDPARRKRYAHLVRNWTQAAWHEPLSDPVDDYTRTTLLGTLGVTTATSPSRPRDLRIRPSTSLRATLTATLLARPGGGGGRSPWVKDYASRLAARHSGLNLFDAAALEASGRLTGNHTWLEKARSAARELRTTDGGYRMARRYPAETVTADALGAWITGHGLRRGVLERTGLCHRRVCRDAASLPPGSDSLTATAMVAGLTGTRRDRSFPLFLG